MRSAVRRSVCLTMRRRQLSTSELAKYQRDGWVIPEHQLSPADLRSAQAAANDLITNNPQAQTHTRNKRAHPSVHIRVTYCTAHPRTRDCFIRTPAAVAATLRCSPNSS